MTPERQRRRQALFEQASKLPPGQVQDFLRAECDGDSELRLAVERLLTLDREIPESFLDRPAMDVAARLLAGSNRRDSEMLRSGMEFANYRLVRKLGQGGMGAVYEAIDLRLQRPVALKVLPEIYVSDPMRVRRFEQEARAVSLLNHPNIVSIYDADRDAASGLHYIATELVHGKTIRELAQGRPVARKQLLDIAIQIASAISVAHHAGIVHRDLKPENVMVREDGIVKVLDFGLAKLTDPSGADSNDSQGTLTRAGQVAGTIHYLSPEQVLGNAAGPRSDLFSLGVVLYEMATGARPFQGPTEGAIFDAILHAQPHPPRDICPALSDALEQVILRCLEKDPELRFQTAADLGSSLKRLALESQSGATVPASVVRGRRRRVPLWVPIIIGVLAIALLSQSLYVWNAHQRVPLPVAVAFERLTADPGEEITPSASADGSQFVYASARRGNWDIYLQRTGGRTAINLTQDYPERDCHPALSPDGNSIAFRSERGGGGIFVMETTGENPRRVSSAGYYPAWSPDGRHLVYSPIDTIHPSRFLRVNRNVAIVNVSTGDRRELAGSIDGAQPVWSPDGSRIAYWTLTGTGGQRDIYTIAADGQSPPVAVTNDAAVDWNPVWSPDGRALYFLSDRGGTMNVWRLPIAQRTGIPSGNAEPVTTPAAYTKFLSIPANGSQFLFVRAEQTVVLYQAALDINGQRLSQPPSRIPASFAIAGFSVSPDGKRIVFDNLGDPQEDLWVMNVDGSGIRRLTNDLAKDRDPAWSPDGREIAFYSDRDSTNYGIWTIQADGGGLRRITDFPPEYVPMSPAYFDGGRRLMIFCLDRPPSWVDRKALAQRTPPTPLPGLPPLNWSLMPSRNPLPDSRQDDQWLGAQREPGSRFGKLFRYHMKEGRVEDFGVIGRSPAWMPGREQFVFHRGGDILLYDILTRKEKLLHSFAPNEPWQLRLSPDGSTIYASVTLREGDIWMGRFKTAP